MKARYYQDLVSVYIHTDFDLREKHEELEEGLKVEGVEKTSLGRYYAAATAGYLFDIENVSAKVRLAFENITGVRVSNKINTDEVLKKALGQNERDKLEKLDLMTRLADGLSEA